MSEARTRRIERQVTAKDLVERLLPDLNMNELLLWAPDLFAYTSYIMSQTGTYQIVVSPPSGKSWAPRNHEILELIGNDSKQILDWLKGFLIENTEENVEKLISDNDAEKWIFDPEMWTPYTEGDYFDKEAVDRWKNKGVSHEARLADIAGHIYANAKKSLQKPLLNREVESIIRKLPQFDGTNTAEAKRRLDPQLERAVKAEAARGLEKIKFERPELKKFFFEGKSVKFEKKNPLDKTEEELIKKYEHLLRTRFNDTPKDPEKVTLRDLLRFDEEQNWVQLVQLIGDEWEQSLNQISDDEFFIINDGERETDPAKDVGELIKDENGKIIQWRQPRLKERYDISVNKAGYINREKDALGILLKHTPPLLLAVWAYFYNHVTHENFYGNDNRSLRVSELLCNQDHLQDELLIELENIQADEGAETDAISGDKKKMDKLWKISVALLTMHAVTDICCTSWGLKSVENDGSSLKAQHWAERLLFSKGSLATINPERCRVIPKRHNPQVGITLRSLSTNLAFHNSSVEVVWRKTSNTRLESYLDEESDDREKSISLLLIPYPFDVKSKDFEPDIAANKKVGLPVEYGFFSYNPSPKKAENDESVILAKEAEDKDNDIILKLVERAKDELSGKNPYVDMVVFPEAALSRDQFIRLQGKFSNSATLSDNSPSIFIAGVRESRDDVAKELKERIERQGLNLTKDYRADKVNFNRNAVYCKYYYIKNSDSKPDSASDSKSDSGYGEPFNDGQTPKYKQYKHHRWKLDASQIDRYGLSQILDDEMVWWESIKVPRRRVSFLNIGRQITIANLICEDLARQDPIADLIRHVGPSLVITLLMDGPQLRNRWSSRYASILSDDPGSSVITLTSWGMVKRHISMFGLMSRVVALWSESDSGILREIELADGAQAILLNLRLKKKNEKTADGRQERFETTVLRLKDVIQIYLDKS